MSKLSGVIVFFALISTACAAFIGYAEGRKDTNMQYQIILGDITASSLTLLNVAQQQKNITDNLECMFEKFIGYETGPGEKKKELPEKYKSAKKMGEKV